VEAKIFRHISYYRIDQLFINLGMGMSYTARLSIPIAAKIVGIAQNGKYVKLITINRVDEDNVNLDGAMVDRYIYFTSGQSMGEKIHSIIGVAMSGETGILICEIAPGEKWNTLNTATLVD